MKSYPDTFGIKVLDDLREVMVSIGLPKKLYNSRCVMAIAALAGLTEGVKWKSVTEQYMSPHDVIFFINLHFPNKAGLDSKGYQENSRETFRDETLAEFTHAGLTEAKPGVSTNSKDNGYRLTAEFAALLRNHDSDRWEDELEAFNAKHEAYAEKLKQVRHLDKGIPVDIDGLHLELRRGGHNKLQAQILTEFVGNFASGAEPLYVGDATDRDKLTKSDRLKELGIYVYEASSKLPDIVLYDTARKRVIFIEAYYSSGEFTVMRVDEIKKLCHCAEDIEVVFVTAFPNMAKMKRAFENIAWDTEIWVADNPTHMIHKNGDKFISRHHPA